MGSHKGVITVCIYIRKSSMFHILVKDFSHRYAFYIYSLFLQTLVYREKLGNVGLCYFFLVNLARLFLKEIIYNERSRYLHNTKLVHVINFYINDIITNVVTKIF